MTTKEACSYLEISRPTLYKRIEEGKLHPLPRQNFAKEREPMRFRRADLDALKSGKPNPPSEAGA